MEEQQKVIQDPYYSKHTGEAIDDAVDKAKVMQQAIATAVAPLATKTELNQTNAAVSGLSNSKADKTALEKTNEEVATLGLKQSELESDVQTISHTETINPSAWYAYFPNVTIQKGERFRIKITSDNPITRMILGSSDARIIDTSDTTILQSNEWIERNSAATRTGIGVYVSTENGSSANLQIEIQKGLTLLEEDVTKLETNLDQLSSDYHGYNAERVVRNGEWNNLFTNLQLSKDEKFRMRINTQSTFTRLILGNKDERIYDSDTKGIPSNDTWINLSSNYDLSSVGIYMVFPDGIAANVKVEIQKGVGALSGEVDEIKNDISLLPNVKEIVAENLGEFRQSAETSVQNGRLLTGLHIKKGDIFRVKVNASSTDWSRVFLYFNEAVTFANRLWDSDGDIDRTNIWASYEAKTDIYSLGLYIVSSGAKFSLELEKQGFLDRVVTSDVLSELESDVRTISHTETINPSAWYAYFPNVTIQKGERFRIKITSDNPITRMILGSSDARIIDTSDTTILQSNEWIERNSAATRTGIGVYVSTKNGSSANLQIEIQKGLTLLEEDVTKLETNLDQLSSDYHGYNAERVVRNGEWNNLFTNLQLSKDEKFRMRINTQSTFTRLILGNKDERIYDSDTKGIPSNDTWINLSSNYDLSSVGIYMVFPDGIAANVKVEIQKGVGALSGEVDEIKNDISLLPNVKEIVAENLGEFRQSAETSVQNGRLLTGLHIKKGDIFRVKVNASSTDWSRVFLYFNEAVTFANRLWDSDGDIDRTNIWASYEAKTDIYSLGLYIVSSGAKFSLELEKQGFLDRVVTSDVLWGKKWAVCGDSFTDGVTRTLVQDGKYAGKRYVYPYLIGSRCNMEILKFFDGGKTLAYPASGGFENSLTAPSQPFYYQNIPEDVDYITIYLGINDSHHNYGSSGSDGEDVTGSIPLGTIEDNTTASYYGAWNVVLSWLIENRPFAHIGIIVSNGCDSDSYRIAQIEVAKKYGIPYIDLNGDERTPAMIRSTNPNIAASVKESRLRTQSVSETNSHPNDAAHLFESTFIENFLRSL